MEKILFTAIAAVSLDSKIAFNENQPSDWTSPEDKKFLRQELDQSDAIIVGHKTYQVSIAPLSKRNCLVLTRSVQTKEQLNPLCLLVNPENLDLRELVVSLGYKHIAVLGGSKTYGYCLQNGMIDRLYLTFEPVIFGSGLPLFTLPTGNPVQKKIKLLSLEQINIAGSVLAKYEIE